MYYLNYYLEDYYYINTFGSAQFLTGSWSLTGINNFQNFPIFVEMSSTKISKVKKKERQNNSEDK